jgi:modulator of FtsH protease
MYPNSDYRTSPIVIEGRSTTTTSLLSKVLLFTSIGFLVSAVGVALAPAYLGGLGLLLCVVASFALIFAVRATRATPALSFLMFLLLTLVMGFEISPWINQLLHTGQSGVVFNAALTTAVGMGCMGIGAQIFSFDYRRVGNYALGALLVLVLVGILGMFFHFVSPSFYAWATLAIFSVLTVVDFMRIRNGGDGQTAIELSVNIYLDGLNIFLALTRIFSGNRD